MSPPVPIEPALVYELLEWTEEHGGPNYVDPQEFAERVNAARVDWNGSESPSDRDLVGRLLEVLDHVASQRSVHLSSVCEPAWSDG